jgi:hypothetical protein
MGVFRAGQWILDENGNGVLEAGDARATFGGAGDQPITGDWSGNRRTNIGVYRNGEWYLDYDGDRVWNATNDRRYVFGVAGDKPCTGDWTNSGTDKIGVYRGVPANNGNFYLDNNGNGVSDSGEGPIWYGLAADIPVPAPWGMTTRSHIGIFRSGQWDVDTSGNNYWDPDRTMYFGQAGDTPVVFVHP